MAFTCTPNLLTHGPLAAAESGGVVRSHTTSYLVEGDDLDFGTGGDAPVQVLNKHDIIGLPMPGDRLFMQFDSPWETSDLFVTGRTCRMETPTIAIVDVTWQQFETSLNHPDGIGTSHTVGTKTVTTSTDRSGQPLKVVYGHDITSTTFEEQLASGSVQQPSVTVMDAEPVFEIELVLELDNSRNPSDISRHYVGKTNSAPWRELGENQWLCLAATPRPLNPYVSKIYHSIHSYVFAFQFAASAYDQGWNPTVEWTDPTTRMPPGDLEEGVGRRHVKWYDAVDFNQEPQDLFGI
jgi:hypothetical protein